MSCSQVGAVATSQPFSDKGVSGGDPPSGEGPTIGRWTKLALKSWFVGAKSCKLPGPSGFPPVLAPRRTVLALIPSPSAAPSPLAPAQSPRDAQGTAASACYGNDTRRINQQHRARPADGNGAPVPLVHSEVLARPPVLCPHPVPGAGAAATRHLLRRSHRFPACTHAADLMRNENWVCFSLFFFFSPFPPVCGQLSVPSPRFVRARHSRRLLFPAAAVCRECQ